MGGTPPPPRCPPRDRQSVSCCWREKRSSCPTVTMNPDLIWSDLIWAAPRSRNLFQLILFVQTFNYSDFTAKTKVQTLEWHQMYCLCFLHLLLLLTWAGESRLWSSGLTWRIRRIRRDWSGSAGLLYRLLVFGLEFHLKWGINKRKPHFNLIKTRFYFLFLCKLDIKVVRFRRFSCQSKAVNICK